MAETASTMLPLGTKAIDFKLFDTLSSKELSLTSLRSEIGTVIMFICNHCPYVKHIQSALVDVAKTYQSKGIAFIAISSNDIEAYPQDRPEKMREEGMSHHYPFPYLYDATQKVAKAYHAVCTPDFYVFDKELGCVYRGRFDESTPGNGKTVTGGDLCRALDALIAGGAVSKDQKASVGCGIKWRKDR
jgi:peroxiredoxin